MIYLGSSSPRRIEYIKKITNDFKIINPLFDESKISKNDLFYSFKISRKKLLSIKNLVKPQDFLICFDTIVKYKNHILTKPINEIEAKKDLKMLSNHKHVVITSVTYSYQNKIHTKLIKTQVYFNKLTDKDISTYIKEVYVYDKAGSYAIQEDSSIKLIKEIKGSYSNVVGFPIEYVTKILKKYNII